MKLMLSREDQAKLQAIMAHNLNNRERERAQTILYFSADIPAKEISLVQRLHLDTVYDRRKHQQARGFESLRDRSRSGTSPKLNEAHRRQLSQWAE